MKWSVGVAALAVLIPSLGGAAPAARLGPHTTCIDAESEGGGGTPVAEARMLPGFGTGGFPVRTSSKDAQAWFDYGMQLGHAFSHEGSVAAFRQAQKLDPTCAMCVWGEAWANGPTLNFDKTPDERKALLDLVAKAQVLAEGAPEKERLLIDALRRRYTGEAVAADRAFSEAMDALARRYPEDDEIAVLAADALMVRSSLHQDEAGMPRARELLEAVLKRRPDDTGAIHFYIHATEMTGHAGDALPYAERLGSLAPEASHLVHMPSHTFYRVGRYEDAAAANVRAVEIDKAHAKLPGRSGDAWDLAYHGHNVSFGVGGAMMSGDAKAALALAEHLQPKIDALRAKPQAWAQGQTRPAYFALGRYGDPAKVLAMADPGEALPFMRAMWRYARGEALARQGDAAGVRAEARQLRLSAADLKGAGANAGSAKAMVEIARHVLLGRAAMLEGRFDEAAREFKAGADIQRAKFPDGGDPPPWWYPVRRSVAAAELRAGRYEQAIATANGVLKEWPSDPMTLTVLAMSERALGRTAEADGHFAQARAGWAGDLTHITPMDV